MKSILKNIATILACIAILATSIALPVVSPSIVKAATGTFYPDAHTESSSVDGWVSAEEGEGVSWSTIRNHIGTYANDSSTTASITLASHGTTNEWYILRRGIVLFDTSSLPDDAVITSATLSLRGYDKSDSPNWQPNINIYSANTLIDTALGGGDYDSLGTTAYCDTAITYNNWSTSGYNEFTLNATGLAAINLTGATEIGIRNVNYDVANVAPSWQSYVSANIYWYTADQGAGYKPKLELTYYQVTSPEITADDESNVGQTTARLNSTLDNDGNDTCEVRFGYGETTQTAENFTSYDTVTDWVDGYETGEHPYIDVSSLSSDTTHFYRVQARNDAGTTTSSNEITFDTEADLNEPDNFIGIPTAISVALKWTKGIGASTTLIRYSFESYPTTTSSGTELYSSTGSNTTHTGLLSGTTVYYSAWGESGGGYSSSYETLMVTTLAGSATETDLTTPVEPANWFIDIDYTTQQNNPMYSTINDIADRLSVPRTTTWMSAAIIIAMIAAFAAYIWRKNLFIATVVLLIMMIIPSAQNLVPGYLIFITAVVIIGIGLNQRRLAT